MRALIAALSTTIALASGLATVTASSAPPAPALTPIQRVAAARAGRLAVAERSTAPIRPRAVVPRISGSPDCSSGWAVANTPSFGNSLLLSASSNTSNQVWAAGFNSTGGSSPVDTTLIEYLNGNTWAGVSTPNPQNGQPGTDSDDLNAVAAPDSSNIYAVGTDTFTPSGSTSASQTTTIALYGNAVSGFNQIPSANPGATLSEYFGAAASDSTHVLAVGTYDDPTSHILQPLVSGGNPTGISSRQIIPGMDPALIDTVLNAVAMVSASDWWVAGYTQASSTAPRQTLVLRNVGNAWSVIPSDNPAGSNSLDSIRADASGDIWAVGHSESASGSQTLVERYNGTRFVTVPSPSPRAGANDLFGVAPIGPNAAWAVGQTSDSTATGAVYDNLIEHWDGTSWKVVPAPANSTGSALLADVVTISPQNAWIVGGYLDVNNHLQTLAANECAGAPTITTVTPGSGPVTGGTTVVLTGTNLATTSAVSFGGSPATSFRVDSDTQITAFTPSHAEGLVNAQVNAWGGVTTAAAGNQYTYVPYAFAPSPMAPDGTLKAAQTASVTLALKNPNGTPQPATSVWLSLASGALGTATAGASNTPLTASPALFTTDTSGNVPIVYTAPSPLPSSTVPSDTITAQNAATAPTEMSTDSYTFSRSFYFAEGYTGCNFSESLSILMPNQSGNASIDYYTKNGHVGPVGKGVLAGAVAVEDVNRDVPASSEVSAKVTLPAPGVVERTLHFINCGNWNGSTDVVGVTQPSLEWDFAEGSTLSAYSEFLTLQNPNLASVAVSLQYYTDIAGVNPLKQLILPGNSRTTVVVNNGNRLSDTNCTPGAGGTCGVGAGIGGVSVKITSDGPIIAERPFYVENFNFGSGAIRDGHDAFGANAPATSWSFAEGNTLKGWNEYLTLQNPNSSQLTADLDYFTDKGVHVTKTVTLPAASRTTILVFGGSPTTGIPSCTAGAGGNCGIGPGVLGVSVTVTSHGGPIVAERPMYMVQNFGTGSVNGAHVAVGATGLATLFGFSAAATTTGNNDYLTILNSDPTHVAHITLNYYATSGATTQTITRTFTVPANTRHTVLMYSVVNPTDGQTDGAGPGYSPLGVVLSSDLPVLVEKPTYSSNTSTYGATDTVAYSPASFLLTP